MTLDATAQALVADTAAPEETVIEAPADTPEMTEDEALDAAYDRLTADGVEDEPEAAPEAEPEAAEADKPAKQAESAETDEAAPTDLPAGIKNAWKDIPKDARDAIVASQRDLGKKLAEQGRLVQGMSPIKSAVERAAKEMPHMMNMTPDQIAADVFSLAKMSHDFNSKPVETLMGLIQKHGMGEAITQALSGQDVTQSAQQTAALQNKVTQLEQQLAQVSDPSRLRETFNSFNAETQALTEVQAFSGTAEHWGAVEGHMPQIIPIVQEKLGAGASAKDVLSAAYELAVNIYLPETKAQSQPAVKAPAVTDPAKTEAAIKAKSINVTSQSTGKVRELSEDEALDAAFDRAMKR